MPVSFLPEDQIRGISDNLLREHQPGGGIPVQIEEIIEFGLGVEVHPIRALNARFGFEGAVTHDLQTILVDEDVMNRAPNRYRFTLAHEMGHIVMHGDYISSLSFSNSGEWKEAVLAIDAKMYGRMESQA